MRVLLPLLAGAMLAAQSQPPANLRALIDQLERGGRQPAPTDLQMLSRAFQAELGAAQELTPEQRVLLARTYQYLAGAQAAGRTNPGLGMAAAAAWQDVARALDRPAGPLDRDAALLGYRNAYVLYSRYGSGGMDLGPVAGRIRGLGGQLPLWISTGGGPNPPPEPATWGGLPLETRAPASRPSLAEMPPFPEMDTSGFSPADREAYVALGERYSAVSASAYTALVSTESIRASLEGRGLVLNPDAEQNLARMKMAMDAARRSIEARRWRDAHGSLDAAAEHARRLLALGGR
jgi:hypothetical protein